MRRLDYKHSVRQRIGQIIFQVSSATASID